MRTNEELHNHKMFLLFSLMTIISAFWACFLLSLGWNFFYEFMRQNEKMVLSYFGIGLLIMISFVLYYNKKSDSLDFQRVRIRS